MVGYLYNGVIASYSSLCVIFMPHICQKANFKHALKLTDNPVLSGNFDFRERTLN